MRTPFKFLPFITLLSLASPSYAMACAVCFAPTDTESMSSIFSAISFLAGLTGLVLIGVTFMIFRAIRRADRHRYES